MSRRARGFRRASTVISSIPGPDSIPGLAAWFDSRTDAYFTFGTGAAISAWASRAGSLGATSFTQATSANQPTRATGVASLNSKQGVLFDGTNDQLVTDNKNLWKFIHDGTGMTIFAVRRIDSASAITQLLLCSSNNDPSLAGMTLNYTTSPASNCRIFDAAGAGAINNFTPTGAGTRDSSAWEAWSYATGTLTYARSGSTQTQADTGGHTPSSANPNNALCIGGAPGLPTTSPFKGYAPQLIFYTKVLSSTERTTLATWANSIYGVAV